MKLIPLALHYLERDLIPDRVFVPVTLLLIGVLMCAASMVVGIQDPSMLAVDVE